MKHIITCICLMFVTGLMAQTTPVYSSEARRINMSRVNGKAAANSTPKVMTDSNIEVSAKGAIGVKTNVVEGGLKIIGFAKNSMASAAKLEMGDIITSVNNVPVSSVKELDNSISAYQPGDVVTINYIRGDRKLSKDVRVNRK